MRPVSPLVPNWVRVAVDLEQICHGLAHEDCKCIECVWVVVGECGGYGCGCGWVYARLCVSDVCVDGCVAVSVCG